MTTLAVLIWCASALQGQAAPKADDLEATLVDFKGTVDVKRPEDKDWVPAARNMKLRKGAGVCTAIASTATLLFSSNLKIDVQPLTEARVDELAKETGGIKTELRLKFGIIEVDIQKGDLKSDMKVKAPNSTTSVSGSHGIVRAPATDGGCRVTLRTSTGTWSHDASRVGRDLFGEDVADDYGNQLRDLRLFGSNNDFLDFYGRNQDDLYLGLFTGKSGDANPWDVPFFDWANGGPTSPKNRKQGGLGLPPGIP